MLDSRRARNLAVLSQTRERGPDHCWHVVTEDGVTLQRCSSEWQAQQRARDARTPVKVVKVGGGR